MYADANEAKPQASAPAGENQAHPEAKTPNGAQALQDELNRVKAEMTKLKETLTQRDTELEQMKSNMMYAVAEKESIKRLTKQEADNARKYGIQKFAKDLLDVADTLKRAINSVSEEEVLAARPPMREMYKGVGLTAKALHKAFGEHGVVELNTVVRNMTVRPYS
jgi:molecular chaperone GrpE